MEWSEIDNDGLILTRDLVSPFLEFMGNWGMGVAISNFTFYYEIFTSKKIFYFKL